MASSSSSAAIAVSDPSLPKYDVFISFRGEDTRNGFTSHLHSALCDGKQITVYIDEVDLEKGDTISPALLQAIEGSAISIIVFSENYASSGWCLDELVHILKCKENKNQIVLPIFYGVDPSHIRKQKGSYDLANHEERFGMEKVEEWKQALTGAANLSGWDSREKPETMILKQVVEHVREKLVPIWSTARATDDLKGLVGIHPRLEKIESLLRVVDIVGICGMGGIGKTTLASAVFKRLSNQYAGSYFAANVREESNKKGLPNFANEVFSKLLKEKDIDMHTSEVDVRLCRKKLLLVLDDVDSSELLRDLVRDRQFGHGSKIIITSRDEQVLKPIVDKIYEAEELNSDDAHQLFYLNAFKSKACPTEFREISEKVVSKATGIPLALTTLGSYLYSLTIKEWESALDKLKRIPNRDIQKVLEISYDGLDAEEKDFFLDIACFLKGENRGFVEGILEEHKSIIGITALVNKSLITIDQDGFIRMHDLIQEMGREIVSRSTKNLGERSRLWIAQEVCELLKRKKGTEATEGIYLDATEIEELKLRPDVFEEMCKLRLLKIYAFYPRNYTSNRYKVYFNGDLEYLSDSLRYVHWDYYPEKSLPSNFNPHNLVELHMHRGKLEQLWDGVKNCGSLKHINLSFSDHLTKIPDLSLAPKLESIDLSVCDNLKTLPKLSENLQVLRQLCLEGCSSLENLPSNIWRLKALEEINLSCCPKLRKLPKIENHSEHLWTLNLSESGIRELPSSIENLIGLRDLDLSYCKHLEELPSSICKLTRLQRLSLNCNVGGLSKLKKFPMLSGLCSLTDLHLRGCNITEIPDWLGSLTSLVDLNLTSNNFEGIPSSIGKLCKLKWLDISECKNLQSLPSSIRKLCKLQSLCIRECKNLESLPSSIRKLCKLESLDIRQCKNLQSLPELPSFIESLLADDCSSLETVSTSRSPLITGDRHFSFYNCSKLDENAINTIFYEFRSKVFHTATTPKEEVVKSKLQGIRPRVAVGYPSHEIPEWFNYQSEGSSITIELPPDWYNPKTFLGFVVSILVNGDDCCQGASYSSSCKLYLKTMYGENLEARLSLSMQHVFDHSGLDHVLMSYECLDHSKANFQEYQEAKFEFYVGEKVKRCGVRMLYLEDAVKEKVIENEAEGRKRAKPADLEYQSPGSEIIESDSEEPPPKRTRNLLQGSPSGKEIWHKRNRRATYKRKYNQIPVLGFQRLPRFLRLLKSPSGFQRRISSKFQ